MAAAARTSCPVATGTGSSGHTPHDRSETAPGPRYGPGDRSTVTSSRQLATPGGETMPTVRFTGQLDGCDSTAKLLIGICILTMINVHGP